MTTEKSPSDEEAPKLDVERLHALPTEQQSLALLTFSSDLARFVASLDADAATALQRHVKQQIFTIIGLSSPAPSRVIRNDLGLCLGSILSKGDRKILYETINELLGILTSSKGPKDGAERHAATHCLGSAFEAAGDSAISLSTLACTTTLRQLKSTQNHAGFRSTLFRTLGRICVGVASSLDDTIARDVWKQARQAASTDKSLLVQSSACWSIEQLFQHTTYFGNTSEFEKLQTAMWKVMDSTSPNVRKASASCLSSVYVKHFTTATIFPVSKARKSKKMKPQSTNGDHEEDVERTASPGPPPPSSLSLGMAEILRQMTTQYCRTTTSYRVRAGIISTCLETFRKLGEDVIESNYDLIVMHLFKELLAPASITINRYRLLTTRRFVRIILTDCVGRLMLGESAQIHAVKFVINSILKDYPQSELKERAEPHKQVIIGALDTLTGLIQCLGSAVSSVADLCRSAILQVIEHPSYSVQVHASRCLKAFVLACPSQLLPAVTICMNSVGREVQQLSGPRRSPRKCLGLALGLAAATSASTSQPLYGSVDVYARILSQATAILKSSSGLDIRMSSVQIQVAWIMVGGLMSLGPNFVKTHLSQLLLLWRNALPKPLSDDNIGQRSLLEISFLTHVRECALSSVRAFLEFNGRLVTVDVSKRLTTMLENSITFLSDLPTKRVIEDIQSQLAPSLQLPHYEAMVQRRIFDCYTRLLHLSPLECLDPILQSSALSLATSCFANPDNMSSVSLSSSIASASGSFENIWTIADNSGFGVTSLVQGLRISDIGDVTKTATDHWLAQGDIESVLDNIVRSPTGCDSEHDALALYTGMKEDTLPPLMTSVVDSAIGVFAASMPLRTSRMQQGVLEQIASTLNSISRQQNLGVDIALNTNVGTALFYALRGNGLPQAGFKGQDVEKALQDLLHGLLVRNDIATRHMAAQALGRLCKMSGSDFTAREVGHLVEVIVSNREPVVRSGCAMALGCMTSELGGMAAGLHLKTILGILNSLASDSHPTVHFWALDSLSRIADATSLAFSSYVSSALGMLAQLYVAESHSEASPSVTTSNAELDLPSLTVIARCIDSMINVLGPDLQDMTKTRNMILTLTYQFQIETSPLVASESFKCLENLSMYAPGHISFRPYVRQLQAKISSVESDVQATALLGLFNAMKRGAEEVAANSESNLVDQLWALLHKSYGGGVVRNLIRDWVEQSGIKSIDLWIPRIHRVLTTVKSHKPPPAEVDTSIEQAEADVVDEEVAGFAAAAIHSAKDDPRPSEASQELLRWQARLVAMESLNDILSSVAKDAAMNGDSPNIALLQPRIADIVRIAFSASTAAVVELRIQGVQIIGRVLQIFGRVPDPDFPEATLLEQYQAQISSALTPAFAPDSSPILAAEAVGVCALFISTGIVTNAERMGRILRLLVSALEDFSKDTETVAIGDLKNLSSNAQTMVKLAVYSAWAELQIASQDQDYLRDIIKPHLKKLTPLWLSSLREYARLKFEPDISASGVLSSALEDIYAALSREILLTFYQASWLNFVDAIASLIDEDSDFVFDALDDKSSKNTEIKDVGTKGAEINYRDEPVAFFFVLFGISFEAIMTRPSDDSLVAQKRTLDILHAIRRIVSPSVAGLAIYQEAIFTETMDVLDRLALTEGTEVQTIIVDIARNLCTCHPSARRSSNAPETEEHLSDDIDQLFELTRIIVLVIAQYVPSLSETSPPARTNLSGEVVALINKALTALVDSAEVFPAIIKADLHACILHAFANIFATAACQDAVVPSALPVFRRFTTSLAQNPQVETTEQLRIMLSRLSAVVKKAQARESEAALPAERNNLLAGTMLLSSTAKVFEPQDPLISRFIDDLADCLDNRMTTKVAAGISRSLLLLPAGVDGNASAAESQIAALLFSHLVAFLAQPSQVEGTEETRPVVAHALTTFALALNDQRQRAAVMAVLIPTLLERAEKEGEMVYKESCARLLELARAEPTIFRAIVAGVEEKERTLLQRILVAGGVQSGAGGGNDGQRGRKSLEKENMEPSIALKMDF